MDNWNEKTTATQKSQIREWLNEGKSITPIEALENFGSFRLAAIIFELRQEGMDIETEKYLTPNGKYVARYSLKH